tara:strand:- start:1052 stop:1654 length:603 start_codon:yes stop_codon:yes gene_type:complete
MNLKSAVSHFQFRFNKNTKGEFRNFKPVKEDVDAINCILTELNNRDKNTLAKNNLVAKLLIYQYTQNIRYYGTTVLSDFNLANIDLCKVLEYPLESMFKSFHNDLHSNQLNKLIENSDVNDSINKKVANIRSGKEGVGDFLLAKYKGLENYIIHLESEKITEEQQINVIKDLQDYKKAFTFENTKDKLKEMVANYCNKYN